MSRSFSTLAARFPAVLLAAAFLPLTTSAALAVDWSKVPGREVVTFYPGQASWEWVLTKADHSGAANFREGKNCKGCHNGEEAMIGQTLASGKRLEPNPIPGKRGSIPMDVRFAHDGQRLYVRLEWPDAAGTAPEKMDKDFPVKVTMMFDDGAVGEATRAGCWGVCHDDAAGMASASGKDLRKYLSKSRTKITRKGGGENLKDKAALDQLFGEGHFLEYWQARLSPGKPAVAVDGHILDKREENPAPVVTAEAKLEGGRWSVVLSRPLDPGKPGYKPIVPGKTYSVGFAVHDDHAARRFHHVSFEHTFALDGGTADFVANKQ